MTLAFQFDIELNFLKLEKRLLEIEN